jgi:gluconolactonase
MLDRRTLLGVAGSAAVAGLGGRALAEVTPASDASIVRLDPGLDAVIAPGTKIERVATGFVFTEGPMWRQGRLWFSDLRGDKMLAVTPEGQVSVLLDHASGIPNWPPHADWGTNAMVPDKDGTVLVVQQGGRTIVKMDSQFRMHPYLSTWQGKQLNSPNDLVFARDGSLWFTDPPFGLPGLDKNPNKQIPFNGVFRYADGQLSPAITDLELPNGIGFSPDGRTLYVSNYGPAMYVMAYEVGEGGKLSGARKLIEYAHGTPGKGGPDGLKVDTAGNVWTTGPGGPRILTPEGKVLGQIQFTDASANVGFGGRDGQDAYFCVSGSIYRLRMLVPGELPLYSHWG